MEQTTETLGPVSVAIIEDDEGIRESLGAFLNRSRSCRLNGVYANAETALELLKGGVPDVVLMDINLPGLSGIEATRALKRMHPEARILMFTVYEEGNKLFDSLKAGACGYLLKRTPPDKIVEAIREARLGGLPLNPQMAAKVAGYFQALDSGGKGPDIESLTERERQTLELLAQGFLKKEIAVQMGVSTGTIHQFTKRIYEKLHVHSRTEAVVKYLKR